MKTVIILAVMFSIGAVIGWKIEKPKPGWEKMRRFGAFCTGIMFISPVVFYLLLQLILNAIGVKP